MSADSYFWSLQSRESRFARHGLSARPSLEELVELAIEIDEKLDALYAASQRSAVVDASGKWRAVRRPPSKH